MKNKFMRIAAVMLMLCLVTTCAISGTFAKYTTANNGGDTARVAKWGVTISAPTDKTNGTTFATSYTAGTVDGIEITAKKVLSSNGEDVIAPGTAGKFDIPLMSGTPEVAVVVEYDATLTLTGWEDADGNFYCPIVFTVDGTDYTMASYTSAADFADAVVAAIEALDGEYDVNTDLSTKNITNGVTWSWAFAGDDVKDTYLGDQAANGSASKIVFDLKVTVTQAEG